MSRVKQPYRAAGDAIKALDGSRIGGYLVRFTDEEDRDLHGEWFSKDTEFFLETGYPIKGDRTLFEHGFDEKTKVMPIGLFDFVEKRDIGIWVEAKLKDREEYERMLRELRDSGKAMLSDKDIAHKAEIAETAIKTILNAGTIQWSSGALPQGAQINEETNHIDAWPIIEGTVTFTPAEPDGTEIRMIKSAFDELKALLDYQPHIQPAQAQKDGTDHESAHAADVETGESNTHLSNEVTQPMETNEMNAQDIIDVLQPLLEELQAQAADMGLNEEEAAELADKVVEEVAAEVEAESKANGDGEHDEDEEDEEEMAEKVASRAFQRLIEKSNTRNKAQSAAQKALEKQRLNWQKQQTADKRPPAFSQNGAYDVQVRSKFAGWQAEDYSFALMLAQGTQNSQNPYKLEATQSFYREMADKTLDSYKAGSIRLEPKAVKAFHAIKADEVNYSTQSGFGDEWVFTAWSTNIWEKPRLDNVVTPLLVQVPMPSNPYEYPVESTDPTVFFVGETADEVDLGRNDSNAAIPDTKVATGKVQFNADKFALRVNISAELDEDSQVRLIPQFRAQAERAVMDSQDNVILNGDTSTSGNINLDGGTPGATSDYLATDGLIHQALVSATTNRLDAAGAAPTVSHLRSIRALLGASQGYKPQNLAFIMDFSSYMKLLNADEIQTIDKYGSQATVLTGELGKIDGIPVFVSEQMALADTDGKITDGGNVTDTGRILLVYRPDWYVGFRRRITQHLTFLPFADAWELVMTVRYALTARSYSSAGAQQSTDDSVALLYNIGI